MCQHDDMSCDYCGDPEASLTQIYKNSWVCDACLEWERTADLESYEEDRRRRLAEAAEY